MNDSDKEASQSQYVADELVDVLVELT